MSAELVPLPGNELVPDGWWRDTVVPWADQQGSDDDLRAADAELAGFEAAWRQLDRDTLELARARRYLEVRRGELLGPAAPVGGYREQDQSDSAAVPGENDLEETLARRLRKLAAAKDRVLQLLASATDADMVTRSFLLATITSGNNGKLAQGSAHNEWYTPRRYIAAATSVLGAIDLDPASSAAANQTVGAAEFYDADDDGLTKDWHGRVWLNPPYGRQGELFVRKLCSAYQEGSVTSAIALVNAHGTDTGWFQLLWDHLLCFTNHRISFETAMRTAEVRSTYGSAFAYLGTDRARFADVFGEFGAIVTRWTP